MKLINLALLSTLVLSASLLSAGTAAAHSRHGHTPPPQPDRGWFHPAADQALALQWFDLTKQTVAAAASPQPVTQTRTWAVSWLAAARAVRDGFGSRFRRPRSQPHCTTRSSPRCRANSRSSTRR